MNRVVPDPGGDGLPRAPAGMRVLLRALGLVVRAHPAAALAVLLGTLLLGAAPVAIAWLTKLLVDGMVTGGGDTRQIVLAGAGLTVATLLLHLAPDVLNYVQRQLERRVEYTVRDRMFAKVNTFGGLRMFERPRFHDLLQLALDTGQNAPRQVLGVTLGIVQHTVGLVGFVGILVAINPVVALITVASALPSLVAEIRLGRHRVGLMVRLSPAERRRFFFSSLLVQPEAAKELRLFGLGGYFHGRMLSEVARIQRAERGLDRRTLRVQALLGLLGALTWAAALAYVIALVASGSVGAGDVVAFLGAITGVSTGTTSLFANVAQVAEAVLAFSYYERLLATEPDLPVHAGRPPAPPLRQGIELRDVWFRYDANLPWVLRGVTLRIPAGRSFALVGENGSGKSTLVKLLCGLYVPEKGAVLWDGVDVRELDLVSLRDRIGSVFQDFVRYDLSAAENVGLGDLARLGEEEQVRSAAVRAGIDDTIRRLPRGYRTVLSRVYLFEQAADDEDPGVELSGGQWQRLALARMLMRADRDLLILDEPSSGLDPRAEHELHATVHSATAGRGRLLVSHRLNAVRMADRIAVLEDGRIIEEGDHAGLMRAGGAYARLFTLQASGYRDGAVGSAGSPQAAQHDPTHSALW